MTKPSIDKKIEVELRKQISLYFYNTNAPDAYTEDEIEKYEKEIDWFMKIFNSALQQQKSELVERIEKAKFKERGNKSQKDQIWGINHGLDKAKEIIES